MGGISVPGQRLCLLLTWQSRRHRIPPGKALWVFQEIVWGAGEGGRGGRLRVRGLSTKANVTFWDHLETKWSWSCSKQFQMFPFQRPLAGSGSEAPATFLGIHAGSRVGSGGDPAPSRSCPRSQRDQIPNHLWERQSGTARDQFPHPRLRGMGWESPGEPLPAGVWDLHSQSRGFIPPPWP